MPPTADLNAFKAAVHNGLSGRKLGDAICLLDARWPPQILVYVRALQVRSNSLGNRKPDYRMSILRKMEAVMLQNRALWIGAQYFDAVDKDGAALIGNEFSKRIGIAHSASH